MLPGRVFVVIYLRKAEMRMGHIISRNHEAVSNRVLLFVLLYITLDEQTGLAEDLQSCRPPDL